MTVTRTFLPWYRRGFATTLAGSPPAGKSRAPLPLTIRLRGSDSASDLPAELAGPSDVVGLDPREISRTEPYDGCPDFEPSYFAYLEFTSADMPWRFSPFGPENLELRDPHRPDTAFTTAPSLRPWLALAVIPADAAAVTAAPPGGLPVVSTDAAQLPDSGELWAWAHVQVATTDGQTVEDAVVDPTRRTTRLVCPRRLDAGIRYIAVLVPAFAAGRDALLPAGNETNPLAPAWGSAGPVQLPVYFQWSFTTGDAESFETLARRLRPRQVPDSFAGRVIRTDTPGWGAAGTPGATVLMQGALRPVGATETPPDSVLAESLRAAVSATGTGVQLRPPVYGQDYQRGLTAIPSDSVGWLAQLNMDPRRRMAAGLASWAVAVEQEDLVDQAWRQLAEVGLGARTSTSPDLAAVTAESFDRHRGAAVTASPPALRRMVRAGGPMSAIGVAASLISVTDDATPSPLQSRALDRLVRARASRSEGRSVADERAPTNGQYSPVFTQPGYSLLRATAEEWLLPGVNDVPADTVMLVETNTAFVEAFLVGLNHALSRELLWRRYPLDISGTMFAAFWATKDQQLPLDEWPAASDLGSHTSGPDQLVLLMRGSLLRRFPTAAIYLSSKQADGTETHLTPNLAGTVGVDIAFYGFPLTRDEALAPPPGGGDDWSIVIQEAVGHVRFGLDDADGNSTLDSWQDLDAGNAHFVDHSHVPVAGPLLGVTRPVGAGASATATWGLSSGHLAVAIQQPAFRVRIPAALWLRPLIPLDR